MRQDTYQVQIVLRMKAGDARDVQKDFVAPLLANLPEGVEAVVNIRKTR